MSSLPHNVVSFDDRYRPFDLLLVFGKTIFLASLTVQSVIFFLAVSVVRVESAAANEK